jgi:hypothetical protein
MNQLKPQTTNIEKTLNELYEKWLQEKFEKK